VVRNLAVCNQPSATGAVIVVEVGKSAEVWGFESDGLEWVVID
jgi:hypothetical protein